MSATPEFPRPPFPPQAQKLPGSTGRMDPEPDHGEHTYRGSGRLKDKVAVITGGDSGIGRAVALAYAREGADVLVAYLSEHEDARETERLVKEAGRRCVLFAGDIADPAVCRELIDTAVKEFGRIDILVNNAAHQMSFDDIDEISDQEWDHTFAVNISAMFRLTRDAVKHMKPGSAIINTASVEAYDPTQTILPYSASKAALVALTKGLAKELLEKGIRVNAVAPGPIWTPLNTHGSPPEELKKFGEDAPLGRPGQPVELAPIYVLLASNDGSYITGEVYGVTGGSGIA